MKKSYDVKIKTRIETTEERLERIAVDFVAENGRYDRHARPGYEYSVRYPLTSAHAFFSSDTRELVEKVKEKMRRSSRIK